MFVVTTDSTAYFTREQAEKLDITVVHMTYTVGKERFYESFSGEQEEALKMLGDKKGECKTSQPPQESYKETFSALTNAGKKVLHLSISSRLSGSCSSATVTAKEYGGKVKVIDTLSVTGGQKMLVERAAQLSREGKTLEQAAEILESEKHKINVVFCVEDMEALRRSGRIGFVKQSIGSMLNIMPLLKLQEGTIVSLSNEKGLSNLLKKVKKLLPADCKRIILTGFLNNSTLQKLEGELKSFLGEACIIEQQTAGPVIAIHLGQKSFGISFQTD